MNKIIIYLFMGMGYTTDKCLFTDLPVENINSDVDALEYYVTVLGNKHLIQIHREALTWEVNNEFFKKNKYVFCSLLFNDQWFEDENKFITEDDLKLLLMERAYPKTPNEKIDFLITGLYKYQKEDGQQLYINVELPDSNLIWKYYFFKSYEEYSFYIDTLKNIGILQSIRNGNGDIIVLQFTFKGLNEYIKLTDEGQFSNNTFIAMSFKNETTEIRVAIKEAVVETGFVPILVDERNIDSDKTINDEIIANLKKSKFCIADFTYNSNGVYFESGFALGQGKKVIYTIRQDHLKDAHFDTKSFQHIVYDTPDDLKQKLINKIEAWVK